MRRRRHGEDSDVTVRDAASLGRWELREADGGGFEVFGRPEETGNRQFVQNQGLRKKNDFICLFKRNSLDQ